MNTKKMLIALFTIIYVISPIDLLPGIPVDDLAVAAFGAYQLLAKAAQEEG